jgi:hypothetical protein
VVRGGLSCQAKHIVLAYEVQVTPMVGPAFGQNTNCTTQDA